MTGTGPAGAPANIVAGWGPADTVAALYAASGTGGAPDDAAAACRGGAGREGGGGGNDVTVLGPTAGPIPGPMAASSILNGESAVRF